MHIPLFAKLFLFLLLYCISDLSIKNQVLKDSIRKANKASKIKVE